MESCPYCECETADVLEYDSDEDQYRLQCDNGHTYWAESEDEVWK